MGQDLAYIVGQEAQEFVFVWGPVSYTHLSAGADIIRFVPPLVIREGDVDEMILRLRRAIKASF